MLALHKTYLARVTRDHGGLGKGERVGVYRRGNEWVVMTDRAIGGNVAVVLTEDEARGCLKSFRERDGRPSEATDYHFGIARIQYEDRIIRSSYVS
jgi:hypothetical protein